MAGLLRRPRIHDASRGVWRGKACAVSGPSRRRGLGHRVALVETVGVHASLLSHEERGVARRRVCREPGHSVHRWARIVRNGAGGQPAIHGCSAPGCPYSVTRRPWDRGPRARALPARAYGDWIAAGRRGLSTPARAGRIKAPKRWVSARGDSMPGRRGPAREGGGDELERATGDRPRFPHRGAGGPLLPGRRWR